MKKLIIATNLGRVRVLKYRAAGEDLIQKAHLVEQCGESAKVHVNAIHETVTDQAGRFGQGSSVDRETGMSFGEELNLEREMERGALKRIAGRIENILEAEGSPPWVLAAPQPILASLKDKLPARARETLVTSVGADLTQCDLQEMERRFL